MSVNPDTTVRKLFCLPKTLADEIDDLRFAKRYRSEAAVIRMLLEKGMEVVRQQMAAEAGGTGGGTNHTPPAGA